MEGRRPRPWDKPVQPTQQNPFTPRRVEKTPYILSVSERDDLVREKKELEQTIKESEYWGAGTRASVDKAILRQQIGKIDHALVEGTAKNLGSNGKDKAVTMARRLEKEIKLGMPSYDEMQALEKYPGAVRKHYMWEKKNAKNIEQWKYIKRTLEPNDPTVSNVEQLRSAK